MPSRNTFSLEGPRHDPTFAHNPGNRPPIAAATWATGFGIGLLISPWLAAPALAPTVPPPVPGRSGLRLPRPPERAVEAIGPGIGRAAGSDPRACLILLPIALLLGLVAIALAGLIVWVRGIWRAAAAERTAGEEDSPAEWLARRTAPDPFEVAFPANDVALALLRGLRRATGASRPADPGLTARHRRMARERGGRLAPLEVALAEELDLETATSLASRLSARAGGEIAVSAEGDLDFPIGTAGEAGGAAAPARGEYLDPLTLAPLEAKPGGVPVNIRPHAPAPRWGEPPRRGNGPAGRRGPRDPSRRRGRGRRAGRLELRRRDRAGRARPRNSHPRGRNAPRGGGRRPQRPPPRPPARGVRGDRRARGRGRPGLRERQLNIVFCQDFGARPGDTVAVQGIGGLGHLAIQYASRMGFRTVALSRGPAKEALARELGAHEYVDTAATNAAAALKGLGGADLVLATAPHAAAIASTLDGLKARGKLLIAAAPHEPLTVSAFTLLSGKTIAGWPSGSPIDAEDTLAFSLLSGVQPRKAKTDRDRMRRAVASRTRMRLGDCIEDSDAIRSCIGATAGAPCRREGAARAPPQRDHVL